MYCLYLQGRTESKARKKRAASNKFNARLANSSMVELETVIFSETSGEILAEYMTFI
jgi:hypothetical protein